jgi:hypothetical protein
LPRIRDGKKIIVRNNSKTPVTAMPTSLKGNIKSQTSGYKNNAKMAIGQQIINSISQSKNPAKVSPFYLPGF